MGGIGVGVIPAEKLLDFRSQEAHTDPMPFSCPQCFDTATIDRAGAEIACPYCPITVKITGLAHGFTADPAAYATLQSVTATTATFVSSRNGILIDVAVARQRAMTEARLRGLKGRNWISSGAIAIEARVRKALSTTEESK